MSYLKAQVSEIQQSDSLHLVKFKINKDELCMISLDLDEKIVEGKKVLLTVKPTHITLAKSFEGELSFSNQLQCYVNSCTDGKLLSSIKLEYSEESLESIITRSASKQMDISKGDKIYACINASDLSISEILDD